MHANTQHAQSQNRPRQYLSFRHANTHINTHMHTHTHTTCTHLQTHTRTHLQTCTHTHMNTHTLSCGMIAGHSTHLHSNNEQQGVHVGETRHYSVHQTTHPYQGWVHDHRNHHHHLQHILWTRQAQSIRLTDSLTSFSEQSLQSPQSPLSPSAHPVDQTSTVDTSERQSHFIFRAEFTITAITAITFSTSCGPDKHSQYVWQTVSVPFQSRVYNHRYHLQHILWTRQAQSIRLRDSLRSFSEQSLQSPQSPLSPSAHPVDQTSTVDMSEKQSHFIFGAEFIITAITCSTSCGSDKYSQYVWGTGSVPFRSRVYNHCYHRNHLQHNLGNT